MLNKEATLYDFNMTDVLCWLNTVKCIALTALVNDVVITWPLHRQMTKVLRILLGAFLA